MFGLAAGFLGLGLADWYFVVVFVVFGVGVGGAVWWYYTARIKIGYKAEFYRLMHGVKVKNSVTGQVEVKGGVWKRIGVREIKVTDKEVVFRRGVGGKGDPFQVNLTKPIAQIYGWTLFGFDYDTGDSLTFGGVYQNASPHDIEEFLNDGLIRKMLKFVDQNKAQMMMFIVIFSVLAVMAFVVGLFASPYILPSTVVVTPTPTVTPLVPPV